MDVFAEGPILNVLFANLKAEELDAWYVEPDQILTDAV